MKNTHILIAVAMVAALSMVSCKNNKKTQSQEPTQEEVQEMKQALADSVLAEIDAFVEKNIDASSKKFRLQEMELTDAEKLVKPDYLLDPSTANNLVTRSQKINALAIFVSEQGIRKIYDMPLEETKEVIARLAAEVNHPIDVDLLTSDAAPSEKLKREYEFCKERGELSYFWQFHYALTAETSYILAQNPELFFNKITDEQWQAYIKSLESKFYAINKLAKYDPEMAVLYDFKQQFSVRPSEEERDAVFTSCEGAKNFYIANKDKYIDRRNALLQ